MDINLLPQRKKGFFTEERLLLYTRIAAVASVVIVLSLSILFFLLSRDPAVVQLKAQQKTILAQLTLLHDKTAKYLIIVDRVNKIKVLQKKRTGIEDALSILSQQIPSGVVITNLTMDKTALSISLSATDVSLLGKTLTNFTSLIANKKLLKSLTVEGLISDEKAKNYVLTLGGDVL